MPEAAAEQPAPEVVDLKEPALAALLGWVIPGLGHWYQGRRAKAVLFFVCIMGTFVYGVYLTSSNAPVDNKKDTTIGWGRAVYFSWRDNDRRLPYLCQIGIGLPALPALIQANRMANNQKVWWHGFMAPPRLPGLPVAGRGEDQNLDQPTPHDLHRQLHRFFELGTVFTMVGGLLNVLAMYDAWGGPVAAPPKKEDEDDSDDETKDEAQP